ncbi:MAG TPA: chromate resistance protein ChrB domain-containing protein [Myxococcota bacterium]|nr:chromate resistance protein ChrB domain-containing protein [Myxococcota bacterium]
MIQLNQGTSSPRWLLLIHQIPPDPAYLRVRIGRRLQALGAVPVKNAVYVLPATEAAREDFGWVLREIADSGGEAALVEAKLIEGLRDEDVVGLFHAARSDDYARVAERARKLDASLGRKRAAAPPRAVAELRRIEAQLAGTVALDWFEAPGREVAEGLVEAIATRIRTSSSTEREAEAPAAARPDLAQVSGATWITRRGVRVDRIASAWLICRFVDRAARFAFVAPRGHRPRSGEIRFDMYEAEFTHDGDRCTFEVLLDAAAIKDPALRAIGEVVHDIDIKDEKFGRPETAGVARLLDGIAVSHPADERRIERGSEVFDELYRAFGGRR